MCTRWLTNWGFSIGIEDVAPSASVSALKQSMIDEGYRIADARIAEYGSGRLALLPGCDEEQSLEVGQGGGEGGGCIVSPCGSPCCAGVRQGVSRCLAYVRRITAPAPRTSLLPLPSTPGP